MGRPAALLAADRALYDQMGGGEIRVPHGVNVQVPNFALMGGNDLRLGDEVAPAGAPAIHVRLVSIMGGCKVRRGVSAAATSAG